MTEEYSIKQLEKTFLEHAEKNIRNHEKDVETFKIKYPDEKLPDNYVNMFSISTALHVICKEINQLKNVINGRRYEILKDLPID